MKRSSVPGAAWRLWHEFFGVDPSVPPKGCKDTPSRLVTPPGACWPTNLPFSPKHQPSFKSRDCCTPATKPCHSPKAGRQIWVSFGSEKINSCVTFLVLPTKRRRRFQQHRKGSSWYRWQLFSGSAGTSLQPQLQGRAGAQTHAGDCFPPAAPPLMCRFSRSLLGWLTHSHTRNSAWEPHSCCQGSRALRGLNKHH